MALSRDQAKIERHREYVDRYLALLKQSRETPSLDYLNRLMESHLYKVPFDGSNFTRQKPEKFTLKNKEILKGFLDGNGGVCYQTHGAFKKLLSLLGFDATLVTVTMHRFGRSQPKPYAEMGRDVHCAIIVKLDGREYLVDMVWGNAFRIPLLINQGEELENITVKPEYDDERQCVKLGDHYELRVKIDNEWHLEYTFKNSPKKTKDFANDVKFICSKEHHLSQTLLLMKPLPGGEFAYVSQDIYKKNNGVLFFSFKSPGLDKTQTNELKERVVAQKKLKEFGVSDESCGEILDRIGMKR